VHYPFGGVTGAIRVAFVQQSMGRPGSGAVPECEDGDSVLAILFVVDTAHRWRRGCPQPATWGLVARAPSA